MLAKISRGASDVLQGQSWTLEVVCNEEGQDESLDLGVSLISLYSQPDCGRRGLLSGI